MIKRGPEVLTDGSKTDIELPAIKDVDFDFNDNFIVYPEGTNTENTPVEMGPNIKPFPRNTALADTVEAVVTLHAGDNITTDDIMPSDSKLLPYRSNVPYLSNHCFAKIDSEFAGRCQAVDGCAIVGGENYGQGSSREHAALVPLYLGVRAVIAKSFARIHMANLINSGILPLVFDNAAEYDGIEEGDALVIEDAPAQIAAGGSIVVKNVTRGTEFATSLNVSQRLRDIILACGLILYTREGADR